MYVKLENNIPVRWPISEYEIRAAHPGDSLPEYISDTLAFELGYGPFVFNGYPPEYRQEWQNIEEITPVLLDGKYQQTYKITEKYTPEERKIIEDTKMRQENKVQAEQFLSFTDWTTIPDVFDPTISNPYLINAAEFASWRSKIRAIAVNPPVMVDVWPEKPEAQWSNV